MSTSPPFAAVLFDLGGVLVRLGGVDCMVGLTGMTDRDAVMARWLTCPWVRDFECGRCDADAFAAGMVEAWELPVSGERFLAEFAAWPEALFEGADRLVAAVRRQVTVASLSNTNTLHWEAVTRRWQVGDWFDLNLLSHELGLVKPDAAVFERATAALGHPAGRILLLDDLQENVDAARACGIEAVAVAGVDAARAALVDRGVLGAGTGS